MGTLFAVTTDSCAANRLDETPNVQVTGEHFKVLAGSCRPSAADRDFLSMSAAGPPWPPDSCHLAARRCSHLCKQCGDLSALRVTCLGSRSDTRGPGLRRSRRCIGANQSARAAQSLSVTRLGLTTSSSERLAKEHAGKSIDNAAIKFRVADPGVESPVLGHQLVRSQID